jgi:hypothetical protein
LRDASNSLLTNQEVGMQISILQSTATGTAVYLETQTATTNLNGLISIEIGLGTSSDDFSAIDWSAGPYFIKTATDPTGGSNYTIIGTSQFMSVPYALYAKNSGSSIAGPQGDKGDTGAQGEKGDTGGEKGDTGATGDKGATGGQGDKGDTGAAGTDGANGGEKGDTGAQGDAGGATGPKGDTGEIGPQGPSGGATGPQGKTGPPGSDGSNGGQGAKGEKGDIGETGADATGEKGAKGEPGADGDPGADGAKGDKGADGTGGVTVGGLGILVEGAGTSDDNYIVSTKVYTSSSPVETSELGGIIFRLSDDGRHGLVVATVDQSIASNWYNAQDVISDPTKHDEDGQKFSNWRLPTKYELNEIMSNNAAKASLTPAVTYWSSTETSSSTNTSVSASTQQNTLVNPQGTDFKDDPNYVRAVRSF